MAKATPAPTPEPPLPAEVYAVFSGSIDEEAVSRIFRALTAASTNSVKQMHLLLQSQGGGIGEGVTLYNCFRALPFDLTTYNTGTVASIATIAYLGARQRKTSAHAVFVIHRTQTTTQYVNTQTIKALADGGVINDQRTEAILRKHVTMPSEKWLQFDHNDFMFTAEEAVKVGISDEIRECVSGSSYLPQTQENGRGSPLASGTTPWTFTLQAVYASDTVCWHSN